ncbi:hypothetical protein ACIGO6_33390 [Streptomyces sp. NPDC053750]|uniref:hypothetical protein n=1 Tax=Streptomyces sp. NPDC053750 TaxID=3365714 RepID=UPI0037CEC9F4
MIGVAAAAGVAFFNAFANTAGLAVTPLIGTVKDATGSSGFRPGWWRRSGRHAMPQTSPTPGFERAVAS